MDDLLEYTPWLMTAEALWDFVAREPDSSFSATSIASDFPQDDETPLFI